MFMSIVEAVKTTLTKSTSPDNDASALKAIALKQRERAEAIATTKDAQARRRAELADVFAELDARHTPTRDTVTPRAAKAMQRASELTQLIDAGDRHLVKLNTEAAALAVEHADILSRISKAGLEDAEARAADKYFQAAVIADEKNAEAVAATEAADRLNEEYRQAVIANGGVPPTSLPLGCVLSTHWCSAPMMKKLGTSFTLSLSTSAQVGRLTFHDCVKFLRKDQ